MFKNKEAARSALAVAIESEITGSPPVLLSVIDTLLTDDGRQAFQHLMKGLERHTYELALDTWTVLKVLHCAYESGKSAAEMIAHFELEKITLSGLILWRIRNSSYPSRNEKLNLPTSQWHQMYKAHRHEAAIPKTTEQLEDDEPDDACWLSDEEMERFAAQDHAGLGGDRAGPLHN